MDVCNTFYIQFSVARHRIRQDHSSLIVKGGLTVGRLLGKKYVLNAYSLLIPRSASRVNWSGKLWDNLSIIKWHGQSQKTLLIKWIYRDWWDGKAIFIHQLAPLGPGPINNQWNQTKTASYWGKNTQQCSVSKRHVAWHSKDEENC